MEEGYKCFRRDGLPDDCVDSLPPTAVLSVKKDNVLTLKFLEPVKCNVNSKFFLNFLIGVRMKSTFMEVNLANTKGSCNVSWQLSTSFAELIAINQMIIHTNVSCSLIGTEIFVIRFKRPDFITDLSNNSMTSSVYKAQALKYVPDSVKAAVSQAGTTFTASAFATFGLVLLMNLVKSAAIGSFWAFVNMLQILSYIPLINFNLPYNLETFMTQYLSVSKITPPYSALPNWIPNVTSYFSSFFIGLSGYRFTLCGYETWSFLYNFSDELTTWMLLAVFYGILRLLTCVIPESRYCFEYEYSKNSCGFIHRWKRDYEYNAIIRILTECYLNMIFCAFLNLWLVFFPL